MKNELTTLQKFVEETIPPQKIIHLSIDELDPLLSGWLDFANTEKERIIDAITDVALHCKDSLVTENYIQHHQLIINTLAGKVLEYRDSINPSTANAIREFYQHICQVLESVLTYILTYFAKYFDANAPLPPHYATIVAVELAKELSAINALFKDMAVKRDLLQIATGPLRRFIDSPENYSYNDLSYRQELAKQLLAITNDDLANLAFYNFTMIADHLKDTGRDEAEITVRLYILLLYMNFNSTEFTGYCIRNLQLKVNAAGPERGQNILAVYSQLLDHLRIKPNAVLDRTEPDSAVDMIKGWINTERNYREQIQPQQFSTNGRPRKNGKLKLKLSSRELAVLLLVFQDEKIGIIQSELNKDTLETISDFLSTVATEDLSPKALKSRLFDVQKGLDRGAVESLKSRMLDCVQLLQKWTAKTP